MIDALFRRPMLGLGILLVLLAVLLSTFKFELADKHIYWNLCPIVYPSVTPDGSKPELPLKVTLLDSKTTGPLA